VIAGERTACPVRTVQSGCEPDDKQARRLITERRHRAGVVTEIFDPYLRQGVGEA
jgi:hypothetical protein